MRLMGWLKGERIPPLPSTRQHMKSVHYSSTITRAAVSALVRCLKGSSSEKNASLSLKDNRAENSIAAKTMLEPISKNMRASGINYTIYLGPELASMHRDFPAGCTTRRFNFFQLYVYPVEVNLLQFYSPGSPMYEVPNVLTNSPGDGEASTRPPRPTTPLGRETNPKSSKAKGKGRMIPLEESDWQPRKATADSDEDEAMVLVISLDDSGIIIGSRFKKNSDYAVR
ncbi:hypothetical protein DFH28DRAFT_922386 [Melampsora americana]|nr:hypothetical protein DFH28DRAFT_922386 [Melampsora americana]